MQALVGEDVAEQDLLVDGFAFARLGLSGR